MRIYVSFLIYSLTSSQYFFLLLEMGFLLPLDSLLCPPRLVISKSKLYFEIQNSLLVLLKTWSFLFYSSSFSLYILSSHIMKIGLILFFSYSLFVFIFIFCNITSRLLNFLKSCSSFYKCNFFPPILAICFYIVTLTERKIT